MISHMAARQVVQSSGIWGITSWVAWGPVVACTAVVEQMKQNFSQILASASASKWPSMPGAASKTAFTCLVRSVGSPVNSPKVMYGGLAAQCRMCPGSAMAETMLQQPASAWPLPQEPTMSLMLDRPSTPFWRGSTRVLGPHQGSQALRQSAASQALQPSMITSATKRSSLSSAWESKMGPRSLAGTCTSPQMEVILTPCSFSAASALFRTM
mmetsp:Transcript_105944/g.252781  ORF Transcript_105944/g.252781 Transcript_105944/m.252781 type:complete len:212 (-) Transcript_105944:161-796(-)